MHMWRHVRSGLVLRSALLAMLVLQAGCDRPASGSTPPADSPATAMWSLASAPTVEIGTDEQPGRELFRVTGAMRAADGSLIVASAGTSDIRVFARDGSWLRKIGRAGDGPGDFKSPIGVLACGGDSIAVLQRGRITLLTASGNFARVITLPLGRDGATSATPVSIGPASCDESLWLRRRALPIDTSGMLEQEYSLRRLDRAGEHEILSFPGQVRFRTTVGGSPAMVRIPFWPEPSWTAWNDVIYWTSGADRIVRVRRDTAGWINWPWAGDRPDITSAERGQYDATRAELLREDARYAGSVLEWAQLPKRPETRPSVSRMLSHDGEFLWLRPYPAGTDGLGINALSPAPERERWTILDARGGTVARIDVPSAFTVTQIRRNEVVGVWKDAEGVETVRVYALQSSR